MSLISFDKQQIRDSLTIENIYDILTDWGGDPQYTDFGIICSTICHNPPGQGSRKLYYYSNTTLYHCYTGCADPSFDIFELTIKVFKIQYDKDIDLNDAVRYIAGKFGISGEYVIEEEENEDWKIFESYSRIQEIEQKDYSVELKEYDKTILNHLNYNIQITPWLKEGITQEAMDNACISYYPGADQIAIPHFDKDGRFVGLRGRSMAQDDIERFGKYRPIKIMKNEWFNHPLGMNLYGLNWAKDNIKALGKAVIFESEKSVLLYMSYFGIENNIAVACCGSNISVYHIHMLLEAGAQEIIIALDRQFQEINDDEFKHLVNNLTKIHNKYKNNVKISFIFDKRMITNYKDAPIDQGPEIFLQLFKERISL